MVEFALATPVFFMLTVAVVDAGRAFYGFNSLAHAARQAARYGAVNGGSQNPGFNWVTPYNGNTPGVYGDSSGHPSSAYTGTATIVGTVARATPGLNLDDLTVTISAPAPDGPSPQNPIQVRLDYVFHPGTSMLINRPITLTASSQMIIE